MKDVCLIADALLNLGQSVHCPLCSEVIYIGDEGYDFLLPQRNCRKIIRAGRKHCLEKHPDKMVWNFAKKDRLVPRNSKDNLDALVCLALSMGAKVFPLIPGVPICFYNTEELLSLWKDRLAAGCAWLHWGLSRRPELVPIFKAYVADAEARLKHLARNQTLLHQALDKEDELGRINLMQLLSCSRTLYRRFL